jgi:protein-S-isoprenylcysteine O-methyltransferase Ste14
MWGLAQALLLQNWIAGPAGLIGFGLLYAFRVGREEAMMREAFGEAYAAYEARTRRIVPFIH